MLNSGLGFLSEALFLSILLSSEIFLKFNWNSYGARKQGFEKKTLRYENTKNSSSNIALKRFAQIIKNN